MVDQAAQTLRIPKEFLADIGAAGQGCCEMLASLAAIATARNVGFACPDFETPRSRQIKIAQAVNAAITIDHAQILAFHPSGPSRSGDSRRACSRTCPALLWSLPILEISLPASRSACVQQFVTLTTDRASSSQNLKSTDILVPPAASLTSRTRLDGFGICSE